MSKERRLEVAAAALEALEELHRDFMFALGALKEPKVNGAEFRIVNGELEVVCLGTVLEANHRLIALGGELECVEYPFVAKEQGEDVYVWSMFLGPGRRLYRDSELEDVICDMSNQYMPSRVAPDLASKLLASKIFSPRQ